MENTPKNPFENIQNSHGCVLTELEPWEIPLMVIRKHWITLVHIGGLVCILVGIFFAVILWGYFARIPSIFTWLTALGIYMVWIQYIFVQWINNELDILIVTNKRIIEYNQLKFLSRKISQASIDQVQEVKASTTGIIGNLLRYGDLMIKTAWDASDFQLSTIPKALETSRIMHALIDEYRHNLWNKK
jgi:hypothetical protein